MKRVKVESSNIHSVSHNRRTNTMTVTFRPKEGQPLKTAAVYEYRDITHEQALALVSAPSVGKHFATHFRHNGDVYFRKVR
jgi:KTSC domain